MVSAVCPDRRIAIEIAIEIEIEIEIAGDGTSHRDTSCSQSGVV
jgi:hypothetical protein